MKNTNITISSSIIREITRKIVYGIKLSENFIIDCDDVRDIIINISDFNKSSNNILNKNDNILSTDINSLYDCIPDIDVYEAMDYALNIILPPNYLSKRLIDLWYKAMKHLFENALFTYKKLLLKLFNTQIQGTISGWDNCSLVLMIN